MKYYALLLFSSVNIVLLYGQYSTVILAEKMGYYNFLHDLRNKSIDHLRKIETAMRDNVAELRINHKNNVAEEREVEYRALYALIDSEFDREFDTFDQRLITEAEKLDNNNAPSDEKELLILSNKQGLEAAIKHIIRHHNPEFSVHNLINS